jgi:hypothetical protein
MRKFDCDSCSVSVRGKVIRAETENNILVRIYL